MNPTLQAVPRAISSHPTPLHHHASAHPDPDDQDPDDPDPRTTTIETILRETERKALVAVLQASPEVTLESLYACFAGPHGPTLRTITVGELLEQAVPFRRSPDGGPPIDPALLEQARRCSGDDYDQLVREAILAAGGRFVSASYLRARVGGPRWKLQASLRRLVDSGQIDRKGVTSSTRYRPGRSAEPSEARAADRAPEPAPAPQPELGTD